jgi:uncharacterized cofD-like protein
MMELKDGTVLDGEWTISDCVELQKKGVKSMKLSPKVDLNPKVERAIRQADLVVLGPGNLYSSLIPNLLVRGLREALQKAYAPTVFVANLMNKKGHTDGFDCHRYVEEIEKHAGGTCIDMVLYNNGALSSELVKRYEEEGDEPVVCVHKGMYKEIQYIEADVISQTIPAQKEGDLIQRTLIRHDPEKLAQTLYSILQDTL